MLLLSSLSVSAPALAASYALVLGERLQGVSLDADEMTREEMMHDQAPPISRASAAGNAFVLNSTTAVPRNIFQFYEGNPPELIADIFAKTRADNPHWSWRQIDSES